MDFQIIEVEHGSDRYQEEVALRYRVLREPLGLTFTSEQLASEVADTHLAILIGGKMCAVLLLTPRNGGDIQMRQVAVAPELQGTGLGRALVNASEEKAITLGYRRMVLHARKSAVGFYERLGYATHGDEFEEVGIPHLDMDRKLTLDSGNMVS